MLLTIEKLIYGGEGLARLPVEPRSGDAPGRGKAVFIPFVLAGEKVEATLTEQKAGFARARADAIVEPSPQRVQPSCPYFSTCGGCHYQHAGYEHQLEIKKEILRETLRRFAKLELPCEIEVHPSPHGTIATALACRSGPSHNSLQDTSSSRRTTCCRLSSARSALR